MRKKDLNIIIESLFELARELCSNILSPNTVFIKRYDTSAPFKDREDSVDYILDCFLKHKVYSKEQIVADINQYERFGFHIKWLDLSLYYSTADETFIVVNLIPSETPVITQHHISVVCTSLDQGEHGPYNVNDFVDDLLKRRRIK